MISVINIGFSKALALNARVKSSFTMCWVLTLALIANLLWSDDVGFGVEPELEETKTGKDGSQG